MQYLIQYKRKEQFYDFKVPHTLLANAMKDFMFYCEFYRDTTVRVVVVFSNGLHQEIIRHYIHEYTNLPVVELNEMLLSEYDKLLSATKINQE